MMQYHHAMNALEAIYFAAALRRPCLIGWNQDKAAWAVYSGDDVPLGYMAEIAIVPGHMPRPLTDNGICVWQSCMRAMSRAA